MLLPPIETKTSIPMRCSSSLSASALAWRKRGHWMIIPRRRLVMGRIGVRRWLRRAQTLWLFRMVGILGMYLSFPFPSFTSIPHHSCLSISMICTTHLTFPHSPGRFFASQQLKLVLAYIALNYDIKPLPSRPANNWFVGTQGPPLECKITIRRREGTV
jgi:hypothetical protein